MNPRPVAAATALLRLVEFLSTSAGLVISLTLRCFGASGELLAMDEEPRYSVFGGLGFAGVVATDSFGQILARTDVAAPGFLAAQYVAIEHF